MRSSFQRFNSGGSGAAPTTPPVGATTYPSIEAVMINTTLRTLRILELSLLRAHHTRRLGDRLRPFNSTVSNAATSFLGC
jgi:hypothetical protein